MTNKPTTDEKQTFTIHISDKRLYGEYINNSCKSVRWQTAQFLKNGAK